MFPLQLHLQVSFTPHNTGHQKQGHHSWRPHCPGPAASHSGSSYSDGESAREEAGARGLYLSWFPQRSRRDTPRTHLDSAGLLPEAGGVPDPKTRYCPVSTEPPLPLALHLAPNTRHQDFWLPTHSPAIKMSAGNTPAVPLADVRSPGNAPLLHVHWMTVALVQGVLGNVVPRS